MPVPLEYASHDILIVAVVAPQRNRVLTTSSHQHNLRPRDVPQQPQTRGVQVQLRNNTENVLLKINVVRVVVLLHPLVVRHLQIGQQFFQFTLQ